MFFATYHRHSYFPDTLYFHSFLHCFKLCNLLHLLYLICNPYMRILVGTWPECYIWTCVYIYVPGAPAWVWDWDSDSIVGRGAWGGWGGAGSAASPSSAVSYPPHHRLRVCLYARWYLHLSVSTMPVCLHLNTLCHSTRSLCTSWVTLLYVPDPSFVWLHGKWQLVITQTELS